MANNNQYDDEYIVAMNQAIAYEYGIDLSTGKKNIATHGIIKQNKIDVEDDLAISLAMTYDNDRTSDKN